MKFESLSLCDPLLRNLKAAGYQQATPIQQQAIPQLLKGRDMVGCAQTGTGKTAAFALPTLQRLMGSEPVPSGAERRRKKTGNRAIRALILAPTRELAGQIGESLTIYGGATGLRHTVIYGGVKQGSQVRALQQGVDLLVATPGRLLDLIGQGFVKLGHVEILILDEADQMLDMGFIHDLRKIIARVPEQRQTLMFSATMPKEVRALATKWLRRPFELQVAPVASTPELVSQAVVFVERNRKTATLSLLLREAGHSKTLVFSRTKRGADKIARLLERDGIRAVAIHGDKSQSRRSAVIRQFNSPHPPVLVATDLAARGLDFSDVSHVINYDMPDAPETYVHRIGRTARAGASGKAISFCGSDERVRLRSIEKLMRRRVAVKKPPTVSDAPRPRVASPKTGQNGTGSNNANANHQDTSPANKQGTQCNSRPPRPGESTPSKRRRFRKTSAAKKKARPSVAGKR